MLIAAFLATATFFTPFSGDRWEPTQAPSVSQVCAWARYHHDMNFACPPISGVPSDGWVRVP